MPATWSRAETLRVAGGHGSLPPTRTHYLDLRGEEETKAGRSGV